MNGGRWRGGIVGVCWACIAVIAGGMEAGAQTPLFFDDIGAGPRAIAMGQAFTAVADDASAAYYNPAGLTQISSQLEMGIGYQFVKPEIYIKVLDKEGNPYEPHWMLEQRDPSRSDDVTTRGVWVGIASNFAHLSVFNDPPSLLRNLAVGYVMFYSLPDVNTFWNPQRKQDPYHLRYNYGYCLLSMAISAGYRITDWLSIGAGVLPRMDTFQDTQSSYLDLRALEDPEESLYRLRLKTRVKVYAEYVVGLLLRPPMRRWQDRVSLGVTYRREVSGYYGTGFSSNDVVWVCREGDECGFTNPDTGEPVGPGSKNLLFPLTARSVDFIGYNPAQLSIGLAVRPVAGLTLSSDVTWKDYSAFKFFWAIPPEPRFKDTWIPRVGLEYVFEPGFKRRFVKRIDAIQVRTGYYYEPSPVPDMNGEMNILDSDMNVVSVGIGLDYLLKSLDVVRLQAYFQVHLTNERYLNNQDDELFGPIWSGGEVYSAGVSLSLKL